MKSFRKTQKWPQGEEWLLLLVLGCSYALDLYNYNNVRLLWPAVDLYWPHIYGMVFTLACFVIWLAWGNRLVWLQRFFGNSPSFYSIIKVAILFEVLISLLVISSSYWLSTLNPVASFGLYVLSSIRFVWGITFSLGLSISLAIISTLFSAHKRSWATGILIGIGLMGPLANTLLILMGATDPYWSFLIPFFFCLPIGYYYANRKSYQTYVELRSNRLEFKDKIRKAFLSRNLWKTYLWLLVSGISVLFCLNILLEKPTLFGYAGKPQEPEYIAEWVSGRYALMVLGTMVCTWLSLQYKSRQLAFRVWTLVGAVCTTLYIFGQAWPDVFSIPLFWAAGLIGLGSGIWVLLMLQGQETFGKEIQPIVLFLLPGFYRISTGIIRQLTDQINSISGWFNKLTPDQSKSLIEWFKKMPPDQNLLDSAPHVYLWIMWIIAMLIFMTSFIASFFWEKNFEGGNNLMAQGYSYTDYEAPVLDHETRNDLGKIADEQWKGEDAEQFLDAIANTVRTRMIDVFDTALYNYNIAFSDILGNKLAFTQPITNDKAFEDLALVDSTQAGNYPEVARRLILESNPFESLTHYSFEAGYSGLVLGNLNPRAERRNSKRLETYAKNKFHYRNLYEIAKPPDSAIDDFWAAGPETQAEIFGQFEDLASESLRTVPEAIRKPLLLRALDAWRYPDQAYFFYVITPSTIRKEIRQQRAAVLLLASRPLPVEKLNELGDMLNWMLAQRTMLLSLDAEWRKISEEQSHSMKTVYGLLQDELENMEASRTDREQFLRYLDAARSMVNRLSRINTLTLALMRDPGDQKYQGILRLKPVSLRVLLWETMQDLKRTLHSIGFSSPGHEDRVRESCFDQLEADLKRPEFDIQVFVVEDALRILLNDLLSNALLNTDFKNPRIELFTREAESYLRLCIGNNDSMDKAYFDLIRESRDAPGISIRQKAGIRMIERLISFSAFNKSGKDGVFWKLDVDPCSIDLLQKKTEVHLLIPKSDIYENSDSSF